VAVGFDLDMTLVDSRAVSRRALERLVCEFGYELDIDALMARYGRPVSEWLPAGTDRGLFRRLQLEEIPLTEPMPGARAAVAATRGAGHRVIVVTAATTNVAERMLNAAGLEVDALRADVWADGKAAPLREERCWAFVGDHPDDMLAARQAAAVAVGVATGAAEPAGADVVLADLNEFPAWLALAL
jgi:phosphoglycolate phosphatase-like HAD superfamily hydrolase